MQEQLNGNPKATATGANVFVVPISLEERGGSTSPLGIEIVELERPILFRILSAGPKAEIHGFRDGDVALAASYKSSGVGCQNCREFDEAFGASDVECWHSDRLLCSIGDPPQ